MSRDKLGDMAIGVSLRDFTLWLSLSEAVNSILRGVAG